MPWIPGHTNQSFLPLDLGEEHKNYQIFNLNPNYEYFIMYKNYKQCLYNNHNNIITY